MHMHWRVQYQWAFVSFNVIGILTLSKFFPVFILFVVVENTTISEFLLINRVCIRVCGLISVDEEMTPGSSLLRIIIN